MGSDREELIRQRAYAIWEEQGKPHGEDMRHWLQAWQELSDADTGAGGVKVKKAAKQDGAAPADSAAASAGNGAAPSKPARKKKS